MLGNLAQQRQLAGFTQVQAVRETMQNCGCGMRMMRSDWGKQAPSGQLRVLIVGHANVTIMNIDAAYSLNATSCVH